MSYEEVVVDECIKELKEVMRDVELSNNSEFRITKNKINTFRLPLFKLFQKAFKEGVYAGKSK